MHAGSWFSFAECFEPQSQLRDGERLFACRNPAGKRFQDGNLSLSRFGETLQLRIIGVAESAIDGLPDTALVAPRLLMENLLPLPGSSFSWRCLLNTKSGQLQSHGLVCVELLLRSFDHRKPVPAGKLQEVEDAFARGLLDDRLHRRADFRLRIRPAIEEFKALRDSGFIPGYRYNVLFSTWRDVTTGDWEMTPLAGCENFEFSFEPLQRQRGFRMTDLFSPEHQ